MTCASVMEFAIGVPVAIVTTRSPCVARRYSSFRCISVARMDPAISAPLMFVTVRRFL
ncbi:hypothetical protein AHiyo8_pI69660 (plasmid) [Arthrobacter sp. Hiyo8]|nr:hypothetical protein AHiyo8_pI69660 [Arthrobacter sp. Hiyo8]